MKTRRSYWSILEFFKGEWRLYCYRTNRVSLKWIAFAHPGAIAVKCNMQEAKDSLQRLQDRFDLPVRKEMQ